MNSEQSGPLTIFGIRVKTIVILAIFAFLLLLVIDRSTLNRFTGLVTPERGLVNQPAPPPGVPEDIVVDSRELSEAMQQVYLQKLAEIEHAKSSVPTDRFFYIIEIHGGSDLEAVDMTIEPDRVIMISAGGTETTIDRTMVKKIHRIKLPPSEK